MACDPGEDWPDTDVPSWASWGPLSDSPGNAVGYDADVMLTPKELAAELKFREERRRSGPPIGFA